MTGGSAVDEVSELFRSVAAELFAYVMVLTGGHRADAEDHVQTAFQAAFEAWSSLRLSDDAGRRAWLRRVAFNTACSAYRKQSRTRLVDPHSRAAELDRVRPPTDPAHRVLAQELLAQCWKVIEGMPPQRRQAIVLRAFGATSGEIAERLGIATGTVRWHWLEATRQLRREIGYVIDVLEEETGQWGEQR